jgi:hypothetical protein
LDDDEIDQPFPVLSDIARDALGQFGKLLAFGLRDIEDVGRAEPNQHGLILGADVLLGLCILLPPNSDHRCEDADAALSLPDLPAKLVPCVESSNTGCVRLLSRDFKDVAEALCHPQDYVECEMERLAGRELSRPAVDIVRVRVWRGTRAVSRLL